MGAQKIVEGMRVALRAERNPDVARKDIARHAGVTPALVTYYFPERNSLVEAATLPVVQALVDSVTACLDRDPTARQDLVRAVEILMESYARDAVAIALFDHHRATAPDSALPDLLGKLEASMRGFFERWLVENPGGLYDAPFLQRAMLGVCKSVVRAESKASEPDGSDDLDHYGSAEMVCCLLIGPALAGRPDSAAASTGFEEACP